VTLHPLARPAGPGGPTHRGTGPQDHPSTADEWTGEWATDVQEPPLARADYFDVAALLDGRLPGPPEPDYGQRADGVRLFYRGQVNLLFGDPESGKTWLALVAAVAALAAGDRVLVLDLDHNGAAATVSRLLALGADAAVLADLDRFRYIEPGDRSELYSVVDDCAEWEPGIAVVDSLGELMPMFGAASNSADDFTSVHAAVLKPLAKSGAAVLLIDHQAKGADSRSFGPGGTGAKLRAIGGVAVRVTVRDAFTPGHGGSALVTVKKDRHGGVRRHCSGGGREPLFGMLRLRAFAGDTLVGEIDTPQDGECAPTDFSLSASNPERTAADVAELDALTPSPRSKRDVQERMGWGSDRANTALGAWRESKAAA